MADPQATSEADNKKVDAEQSVRRPPVAIEHAVHAFVATALHFCTSIWPVVVVKFE
jgi:hypothetical protein